MEKLSNIIHPTNIKDCNLTIVSNDLPLITYNRAGSKSSQELLYEAASESDQNKASTKWNAFTEQVTQDYIRRTETRRLIHTLDEHKQWSALHYAVANNNYYVVRILLAETIDGKDNPYRCDINILNGHGENVLHVAAQSSKLWNSQNLVDRYQTISSDRYIPVVVNLLFENNGFKTGIHVNHEDDEGRTPLHLAVAANQHAFVSYLLRWDADVQAKSIINANIFHFLFVPSDPIQTSENLKDMFDILQEALNEKDKLDLIRSRTLSNQSALVYATGHPNCTQDILEKLADNLSFNQLLTAFDVAATRREVNFHLLEPLLNCLNQKNELLQIACRHDHLEMFRWLLNNENTNEILNMKNYAGYTPLLTAVFYEAKQCVQYLLEIENRNLNWKEQNSDGETIFHIATKDHKKHELLQIITTKIKSNELESILKIKDNAGNTPLHNAIYTNESKPPFELSQIRNIISEKNALGLTAIHIACCMGNEEIVKYFWENNDSQCKQELFRRDNDRRSCLHMAASQGHLNVVKYLVEKVEIEIDTVADRGKTPLHLACQNNHFDVVQYLLEQNASPILRDAQLYNCLEIAIMNQHEHLVQNALLEHVLWREMMRNAQQIKGTKAYDTPMRKLIRYMPNVAIHVIETKLTRTVGGPEQKVFNKIYDYEFFQDELQVEQWYAQGTSLDPSSDRFYDRYKKLSWTETLRCAFCCFYCSHEDKNESNIKRYTDNSYTLVRNHPLFIVSQQASCPNLIYHPYNIYLREQKFHMFGIYLLLFYCLLYTSYLGIFTALVLQNKHPQYFYDLININYTEDLSTCQYVANSLVNSNMIETFKPYSHQALRTAAFVHLIIFVIKNCIVIISLFPKIFRLGAHYLEISVLVLSFVYILDWYDWLDPVLLRCPVQYQIGSFALLLAWLNFLIYFRWIPFWQIGVYVVMLQLILFKFVQFIPVLLIIICGFGFSYWMLLQNQAIYGTPIQALIRTGLMMFDLGYEDRLYNADQNGPVYYTILYVIFILTAIVLCIFVINLMISVAVGEIPSLKDQSILWRHLMMYELLSDYEILRIQLRPIVNTLICGAMDRPRAQGPSIFKCLQRRQDVMMQEDQNDVFWLLRCGRYMQRHFFKDQLQDDVQIQISKNQND